MSDNNRITWTNEKRKLSELIPWPRNPRQVKVDQVKRLQESLEEFGQPETIAIGPGNEIYNGHQRLKSWADKFGDIDVDVRVANRALTEKEREKLTVFLHKGAAGEWDFDILANEFDVDDLLDWGFDEHELDLDLWGVEPEPDPGAQIDRAEELREKWGVESGQLWQLGDHRLICGDCTDAEVVARLMDGKRAELFVTSPPYWTGQPYDEKPGIASVEEFMMRVVGAWFDTIVRRIIIQTGHTSTINIGDGDVLEKIWLPFYWQKAFREKGWLLRNFRVWVKNGGGGLLSQVGPKSDIVDESCEWILTFWTGKNEGGAERVDPEWAMMGHWDIPGEKSKEGHPCPFPIEIAERCVLLYSQVSDIVTDPFLGSGTTLIACERLGRKCRAVEISPAYCAVAIQRWVDMTSGEPELVNS